MIDLVGWPVCTTRTPSSLWYTTVPAHSHWRWWSCCAGKAYRRNPYHSILSVRTRVSGTQNGCVSSGAHGRFLVHVPQNTWRAWCKPFIRQQLWTQAVSCWNQMKNWNSWIGKVPDDFTIRTDWETIKVAWENLSLEGCNPSKMAASSSRTPDDEPLKKNNHKLFSRVVWILLLCIAHRIDVSFTIGQLCKHV